jgi:hypothetical protein
MPEIAADPLSPACYDLYPDQDSRDINNLVLISFASRARERLRSDLAGWPVR